MRIAHFFLALLLFPAFISAQQTVGLFQHNGATQDGYLLMAPLASTTTYLFDNCGRLVNSWPNDARPGVAVYLQPDGKLLRTERVNSSTFAAGGIGGRIERINWDGTLDWGFTYADNQMHQHHDVELMPNGNILVLAWEYKSAAQALTAGRDPGTIQSALWPEHIIEVEPFGNNGANVVWEWHLWDHLVQDFDSTRANFGVVADHPELVNLNFGANGSPDWIHANSVAYNPTLDQIVISSRAFSEFWVVDHSTTTAEAAGHAGGNSGKGGDLLYRWGNPQAYNRGTAADQQLFGQHNVHWIPDSIPGGGHFMTFNNGAGRPGFYSSVDVVAPPVDAQGNYTLQTGQAYGPDSAYWTYSAPTLGFFSISVSGATRQPNGNTLICSGQQGTFFEVDAQGNRVWEYVNPVGVNGPVAQGDPVAGNSVFRAERYLPDFPGFAGQSLVPGNPIELNPSPPLAICDPNGLAVGASVELQAWPNPFSEKLLLRQLDQESVEVEVYNTAGQRFATIFVAEGTAEVSTTNWPAGIYHLHVPGQGSMRLLKCF